MSEDRQTKSVPIHDAYGDGVSPDTFSDIIDKLDTTTLHNDIVIMVVCESTGKKYEALADVMMSNDGTLCISGIKHDDEAIAEECMEKLFQGCEVALYSLARISQSFKTTLQSRLSVAE